MNIQIAKDDLLAERNEDFLLGQYHLVKKLGSGGFGDVFEAVDLTGKVVALKCEEENTNSTLAKEAMILKDLKGVVGFPQIFNFFHTDSRGLLSMTLLGSNLETIFQSCSRKFSLATGLMLADQMLTRIEKLHAAGYIHRDIKPENFTIGRSRDPSSYSHSTLAEQKTIYLIDFGLSKLYKDAVGEHIPYKKTREIIGTTRYMSINANEGHIQSRRDDLESLGYVLVYLLKGTLPWMGLYSDDPKSHFKQVLEMKKHTSIDSLCEGLPDVFISYFKEVRSLDFTQDPDYAKYRGLFSNLIKDAGLQSDYQWDWLNQQPQQQQEEKLGMVNKDRIQEIETLKDDVLGLNSPEDCIVEKPKESEATGYLESEESKRFGFSPSVYEKSDNLVENSSGIHFPFDNINDSGLRTSSNVLGDPKLVKSSSKCINGQCLEKLTNHIVESFHPSTFVHRPEPSDSIPETPIHAHTPVRRSKFGKHQTQPPPKVAQHPMDEGFGDYIDNWSEGDVEPSLNEVYDVYMKMERLQVNSPRANRTKLNT